MAALLIPRTVIFHRGRIEDGAHMQNHSSGNKILLVAEVILLASAVLLTVVVWHLMPFLYIGDFSFSGKLAPDGLLAAGIPGQASWYAAPVLFLAQKPLVSYIVGFSMVASLIVIVFVVEQPERRLLLEASEVLVSSVLCLLHVGAAWSLICSSA